WSGLSFPSLLGGLTSFSILWSEKFLSMHSAFQEVDWLILWNLGLSQGLPLNQLCSRVSISVHAGNSSGRGRDDRSRLCGKRPTDGRGSEEAGSRRKLGHSNPPGHSDPLTL